MHRKAVELVAFSLLVFAGCSEIAMQPRPTCEVMLAQICTEAADVQLHDGTLAVRYAFRSEEARVAPFVVPVFRQDHVLAAEVDCYANTDSHSYSIVKSDLAIAPSSDESVYFLREQHLCADAGTFAKDLPVRVETATAIPLSSR